MSQTTRMLSFSMMPHEVERATGRSWVVDGADQWEDHRGALGGADHVSTFADDRTVSQQRIVVWRKMALQGCGDLVAAERGAGRRAIFTEVDPGQAIDPAAPATAAQVRALFRRFFLEEPADVEVDDGVALVRTLSSGGGAVAWRGLCSAYLGSMRFLTY
jgi:hypothetical protein